MTFPGIPRHMFSSFENIHQGGMQDSEKKRFLLTSVVRMMRLPDFHALQRFAAGFHPVTSDDRLPQGDPAVVGWDFVVRINSEIAVPKQGQGAV